MTEFDKNIPFNRPSIIGNEIRDAIRRGQLAGDGYYTKKCNEIISSVTLAPVMR